MFFFLQKNRIGATYILLLMTMIVFFIACNNEKSGPSNPAIEKEIQEKAVDTLPNTLFK